MTKITGIFSNVSWASLNFNKKFESIKRLSLYTISMIGYTLSLKTYAPLKAYADVQMHRYEKLFFHPMSREMRVVQDAGLIPKKLQTEFDAAKNQMEQEVDGPFAYRAEALPFDEASSLQIDTVEIGYAHFIGKRSSMQDEHLATAFDLQLPNGEKFRVQLFGIFDGHGFEGAEAADFAQKHLQAILETKLSLYNAEGLSDAGIWNALKMTFVELNHELKADIHYGGSTATVAMILDGNLWTANVGDSRTVLDNSGIATQLSEDASPQDPKYQRGIYTRDGFVQSGRVGGNLAVARALGDADIEGLSARPKITKVPLLSIEEGSHLILTCDGVFDVGSTKQIVDAVHEHKQESAETLAKGIVAGAFLAGSTDNISALVVKIK